MAFPIIQQAVAKVLMESKLKLVDELVEFFGSKVDIDEEIQKIFQEFKDNLKENEEKFVKNAGKKIKLATEKKKRQPSIFNMYVKDVMPTIKSSNVDIKDGKKLISIAAESWKTDPMAAFIKEKVIELKANDSSINVVDLYSNAKALWKPT